VVLAGESASESSGSGHARLLIWVPPARQVGNVLGLCSRDRHTCSLMSRHASTARCAPSLAATPPTLDQLACVLPSDVEDASRIYGGELALADLRCR
jgi:hypothetical protein